MLEELGLGHREFDGDDRPGSKEKRVQEVAAYRLPYLDRH